MTRDKYLIAHVTKKNDVPPVGYYWAGYKAIDRDQRTPMYGSHDKWDDHSKINAEKIKETEFQRSAFAVCPRIDRSLVKYRDHMIEEFKLALGQT